MASITYKEGNSFFHQLHPITKTAWCIGLSIWLFSLRNITDVLIICSFCTLSSFLLARINPIQYLKGIVVLISGAFFLVLFQGFFRPGEGVNLLFLHLSYEGIFLGTAIGLRTFGLVAISLAFSSTTSPKLMTISLIQIGVSYRIAHLIYLSLRILPLIEKDLQIIQEVLAIRSPDLRGFEKLKKTLTNLIVAQLKRSEDIAIALETKGFGLHTKQTLLENPRLGFRDFLLPVVTLVFFFTWILF